MRILRAAALATAILLVLAATADAVSFTFRNVRGATGVGGYIHPGDDITADLWFDTETEHLQAFFLQVDHRGNTATAATIEPFVFAGGQIGTPLGAPVVNGAASGEATGQFVIVVGAPLAFAPGHSAKFGSISFTSIRPGLITIGLAEGGGAVGGIVDGIGGQDLVAAGLVTFGILVPEPTTALLVGVGLLGLGVFARRQ